MTNTDGATIAENKIVRAMYRPTMADGNLQLIQSHIGHRNYFEGKARRAAIGLWSCSNVEVRGNDIIDPEGYCRDSPLQIGDHCKAVRVSQPK